MARKLTLKLFGKDTQKLVEDVAAKVKVNKITLDEAQRLVSEATAKDPYFDYKTHFIDIVAMPPADNRSGNSGADIRVINRIIEKIENADRDFVTLEDTPYSFLANRVSRFTGWSTNNRILNRYIEQFLDDVANAEEVNIAKLVEVKKSGTSE